MRIPRFSHERGQGHHAGWLKSFHSFSFADYYDPNHMHFSHLRVINEDWIKAGFGFGTHPHRDMEILTYVLQGSIAHQDSMGNQTTIQQGEFQIMSAGTGITHSEINPSQEHDTHLYQIWILPNQKGITPRYAQGSFADRYGATLILSPDAAQGAFQIYQDMQLWRWQLPAQQHTPIALNQHRRYWLQMVRGQLHLDGLTLQQGDALAVIDETELNLTSHTDSEFLLFDLV